MTFRPDANADTPRSRLDRGSRIFLQRAIEAARALRDADRRHARNWSPGSDEEPPLGRPLRVDHDVSPPQATEPPPWLQRAGRASWYLIGIGIVVGAIIYATWAIQPVFVALFLALVITSVLEPFTSWMSRLFPRGLATAVALLSLLGIFGGMIAYVVSSVAGQWGLLASQFNSGLVKILDYLQGWPFHLKISEAEFYDWLQRTLSTIREYLQSNATSLASEVVSNVTSVALAATMLALAIFLTVFFLWQGPQMWRWYLDRIPARMRDRTHRAAAAGWYTFSGYARGTMLVAFTDALMCFFLLLATGIPLAAPLSVLVFIGAFIPLVGAPTAMLVAMIVALAAKGVMAMLIVGIGIALIGQIEGHVLQPIIMGSQVSLHPAVVGLGVAAGTLVAGLLGAIVAIPVIAVIWAVYHELHQDDLPVTGKLPGVKEVIRQSNSRRSGSTNAKGTPETEVAGEAKETSSDPGKAKKSRRTKDVKKTGATPKEPEFPETSESPENAQ